MSITYALDPEVSVADIADLFDAANFPDRDGRFPIDDVAKMVRNSNIVVTARDGSRLVGVALAMTNFASVCFLSSFAVHPNYRGCGTGSALVKHTRLAAGGEKISLVSVSTPDAVGFYERIGMEHCRNGFILPRRR